MGVTPEELAKLYPRLHHMAEPGSWESIRKYGLLSTSSLLTLFGINGLARREIEARRRSKSYEIKDAEHGRAVIRDQKPIVESKLKAALQDCTLEEWYALLNSRVFFWLTKERLKVLLSAREYRNKPHTVLTLETLTIAKDYQRSISLSPMNSGNTLPIAHPRGISTFSKMEDYPFQERLKRGLHYAVVELAIEGGVPNIVDYMLRAETMVSNDSGIVVVETLYAR